MTWSDSLRRVNLPDGRRVIGASFRGVAFHVETSERTGGRRTVKHEFPQRDDPYVDDMGRQARVFRVNGYVLGDDFAKQRDALISALEDQAGPGELVHPYYGAKRAICSGFTFSDARDDGGMSLFAIDFEETPVQPTAPTEAPDLPGVVDASSDDALGAVQGDFEGTYDVDGMPSFSLESASRVLTDMSEALGEALAPIIESTQEMAKLTQQIEIIVAQASALVREPAEILTAFRDTLAVLVDTVAGAPGSVLQAFSAAYTADTGPVVLETTATREQERANQLALDAALRRILAIEAARLAPLAEFESIDYAISVRDQIIEMLDEQAETASDDVFPFLIQLRADVVRAVPSQATLAREITMEQRTAIPSLLLTYQLYGSVENEDDVLARNGVRDPRFVSGTLRVLSDV